jgi:hypothetical protein
MLENTEGAIKKEQSRETGNIGYTRRNTNKTPKKPTNKQNIKQHNMCWTPLCANKHK